MCVKRIEGSAPSCNDPLRLYRSTHRTSRLNLVPRVRFRFRRATPPRGHRQTDRAGDREVVQLCCKALRTGSSQSLVHNRLPLEAKNLDITRAQSLAARAHSPRNQKSPKRHGSGSAGEQLRGGLVARRAIVGVVVLHAAQPRILLRGRPCVCAGSLQSIRPQGSRRPAVRRGHDDDPWLCSYWCASPRSVVDGAG